jgi:hypothetical protein
MLLNGSLELKIGTMERKTDEMGVDIKSLLKHLQIT